MEDFDVIFSLNPEARSLPLDSGLISSATRIIEDLCETLNRHGVVTVIEEKEHYHVKITSCPDCCREFYISHKKVPCLAIMHKETSYTDHANEVISYLFHFVCLLARAGNEEAKEVLLKYERNLDLAKIEKLYRDVFYNVFVVNF